MVAPLSLPLQIPLRILHLDWIASLIGPPSAILSSQSSLVNTLIAFQSSALQEKIIITLCLNIALLHAFEGSLACAAASFEEVITRSPHCALAHYGLGIIWYLEGNNVNAIQAWKECIKSFEAMASRGNPEGGCLGPDDISYRVWKSPRCEEVQPGRRGDEVGEDNNMPEQIWILTKGAVLWNLHVAEQRWKKKMNAIFHYEYPDLDENVDMLFIKGIPAGMLFGPPPELMQTRQEPTKQVDHSSVRAHIVSNVLNSGGLVSPSIKSVSISASDNGPRTPSNDQSVPEMSSPLRLMTADDGRRVIDPHDDHGESSNTPVQWENQTAPVQGEIQATTVQGESQTAPVQEENQTAPVTGERQTAHAYQTVKPVVVLRQAAAFPVANPQSQPMELCSVNRNLNRSRSRTIDDAALSHRKPLPPLPGDSTGRPEKFSRYTVTLPHQPRRQAASPPHTLSSSISRFFTKSKQSISGSRASLSDDVRASVGAGGKAAPPHHQPLGLNTNRNLSPLGKQNEGEGKGRGVKPRRPDIPAERLDRSTQDYPADRASRLGFARAVGGPVFRKTYLNPSSWEKRVAEEAAKSPRRLYFPKEEINYTPKVGAAMEVLGSSFPEGSKLPRRLTQHQNQSHPAFLRMLSTSPPTITEPGDDLEGSSIPGMVEVGGRVLNDRSVTRIRATDQATGSNVVRSSAREILRPNHDATYSNADAALWAPSFRPRTSSLTLTRSNSSNWVQSSQPRQYQQPEPGGELSSHLDSDPKQVGEKSDTRVRGGDGGGENTDRSRKNSRSRTRTRTPDQSQSKRAGKTKVTASKCSEVLREQPPARLNSFIAYSPPSNTAGFTPEGKVDRKGELDRNRSGSRGGSRIKPTLETDRGRESSQPAAAASTTTTTAATEKSPEHSHQQHDSGYGDADGYVSGDKIADVDPGGDQSKSQGQQQEQEQPQEQPQEEQQQQQVLLSSEAFQGFANGMMGQWYNGKWV